MKQYIEICNDGEIELAGLTLIGASTKEGQDKIGFFGSGNKYAIATLLRNNIEFHIFSGETLIEVTTKKAMLRNETFQQVYINGQATSFTTRMGPEWEVWFALREFVCNAIDEGAKAELIVTEELRPEAGKTKIYVAMDNNNVTQFYENSEEYMLISNAHLVYDTVESSAYGNIDIIEVLSERNPTGIYRKGIRVHSSVTDALFNYNVDTVDITESRTIKYSYEINSLIKYALYNTSNAEVVKKVISAFNANKSYTETNILENGYAEYLSNTWYELLSNKTVVSKEYVALIGSVIGSNTVVLPKGLVESLNYDKERLKQYNVITPGSGNKIPAIEVIPSKEFRDNVTRSYAKLYVLGYTKLTDVEIKYMQTSENYQDHTAWINRSENDKIYLNVNAKEPITPDILLEELLHLEGYNDCDRPFQEYLLHELIKAKEENLALRKQVLELV